MEPRFKIGDRVTVKGYGNRVYEVLGYTVSEYTDASGTITELYYDVGPVDIIGVFEVIEAAEEDMTLVGPPDLSAVYFFPEKPIDYVITFTFAPESIISDADRREAYINGNDTRNVRRDYANMTPEELIEMYADYMALDRAFGGRVYKRRADAIMAELHKRKEAK
ncbi:hypothetical protein G3578_09810 [Brevibacillus sp. SYP-B805]|uniref:hypothetical protein n=1 Tax=Brevibacillus sp. SYP-B805 TaxID=1578199 RepID=UPI0013EC5AB8|nr:hypothetical protein [Brevibacillus sp. SYP-B805]NGQ95448.1 hypothetical protein [Brevibacillus sp. SYP-B805]